MNDDNIEITDGGFTEEQSATLAKWAAEEGWMPEEEQAPEQEALPVEPPEAMPDVFTGETINPTAYDFGGVQDGEEAMPLEMQVEIRNALAAEGIPVPIGNEMARRWNAVADREYSPEELELTSAREMSALQRLYGDQLPEIINLARSEADRLIARLPWIGDVLASTPLGSDSWVISTLANIASARRG